MIKVKTKNKEFTSVNQSNRYKEKVKQREYQETSRDDRLVETSLNEWGETHKEPTLNDITTKSFDVVENGPQMLNIRLNYDQSMITTEPTKTFENKQNSQGDHGDINIGPLVEESIDSFRLKVEDPLHKGVHKKLNRNSDFANTPKIESSDIAHVINGVNTNKPNTQTLVSNNSPEMSVYNAQQLAIQQIQVAKQEKIKSL